MSKTILELTGVNKKDGLIGIEIEVEGHGLPRNDNVSDKAFHSYWSITQDGSLRGESWEYVFRNPLSFSETCTALASLEGQYKQLGSTVNDSVRAGIHVHINVQDLTLKQLYTMFTVYYCLENVLVDWCGQDRVGNHFCLRACDAEYILYAVHHAFSEGGMAGELAAGDAIRYASMNVASVFKYGSVEFRSLRSTRDWGRILTWVKALTYIKEAANRFADPKAVVENISLNGAVEFARSVLKDLYEVFNTVDMDTKLYSAIRNVQAMAFNLDFNKAEAMNLRFDRNPSYNNLSEKYAQASNSWEKFRDKKGTGEMPLEEPLPQQDLLPVLEVTNRGDRPFVDGEEVEGEDDVDWWGRNSPRVRLRQGAPMPIAEPRQIWADLQVDQAPNNAAVQAQAPGWLRMWDNIGQQGFPAIPEHAQQERLPRQNEAAQQGQPLNDQAFSLIIIDEQPVENPPRRIRPWVRDRT